MLWSVAVLWKYSLKGEKMGKIQAICISEKRGTAKQSIPRARLIENFGVEGDAHGGNWHRQVSLLPLEQAEAFRVEPGAFGENLLVTGFDLKSLPIGSRLRCGDTLLEITQIGKECHSHCDIYKQTGKCIMPREGIFAVVKQGGMIQVGDEIMLEETLLDK